MRIGLDAKTRLERLEEKDAPELFALTDANRKHLRVWLPWLDITTSPADTLDFIRRGLVQDANGKGFHCGIRREARLLGVIGFHEVDREALAASIGYWLAESAQGQGLATLACRGMTAHAFREMGMRRVDVHCATGNERSQRVPERLGFKRGKVVPKAEYLYGKMVDHIVYSMAAADWRP